MKLKLGKMKSQEVAAWLGISYNTYRNNIDKNLSKLEPFCEFEKVYGGIIVKEIIIEEYDKNLQFNDDKLYLTEIKRCIKEQDGLSTVSGMARKFVQAKQYNSERTARRRATRSRNILFGNDKNICSTGIAGSREYVWAIKLDDYNHYRLMTEEEEERFNKIIEICYSSNPEKIKRAALLEEAYRKSETMSKEEYFEERERLGLNVFKECIFQFRDETGLIVVHCSRHELMQDFTLSPEDKAYLAALQ